MNETLADDHVSAHRLESSEHLRVLAATNEEGDSRIPVLHNVDSLDAASLAELDNSHTNRGGGIILDDKVTRGEGLEVCEKSVSDTSAVEKGSSNFSRNAFGSTHDGGFGDNNLFAPSTYSQKGLNETYLGKA